MSTLANKIAQIEGKSFVEAPAGFGKTYLIAEVAKMCEGRALILTHTHAGVSALKKKMKALAVTQESYEITTIASWSLQLCCAYPKNANWSIKYPQKSQWDQLCTATITLLEKGFIKRILTASYSLLIVDEYQDCNKLQHAIINSMASVIPCCILGDPLQGIFEFAGNPISWQDDIYPNFKNIGSLTTPWRWKIVGNGEMGKWLSECRDILKSDRQINLNDSLPRSVNVIYANSDEDLRKLQIRSCWNCAKITNESVIAIHAGNPRFKAKTHKLAQMLSGVFSSIEEVEGNDLAKYIQAYMRADTASEKLLVTIKYASTWMTKVNVNLSSATKKGKHTKIKSNTKNIDVAESANLFLQNPSQFALKRFLKTIPEIKEVKLYRKDLFYRLMNVLSTHIEGNDLTLLEAFEKYQLQLRHAGRPFKHQKIIGTTLLVKGLEFHHAIILNATSLSKKELYVALTRGSTSLTIISNSSLIPAS